MKNMSKLAIALAGVAGLALAAESAQAVTLNANGAGSSAGRGMVQKSVAYYCDQPSNSGLTTFNALAPTPILYQSSENPPNYIEWQCNVGGTDSRIRYTATASANGYLLQPNGAVGTTGYMNLGSSGCSALVSTPNFQGSGVTVNVSTCSAVTTTPMTVHWGGADVKPTSLHQQDVGTSITVPANSHLTPTDTIIVPFSIVVGGNVQDGNGLPLKTLTNQEIWGIFSGAVLNWTDLGYKVSSGSAAITVCYRTAGSGTLASFDEIFMYDKYLGGASNFPLLANATHIANASSSNMVTCLNTNQNSIGILDSDSVTATNFPNGAYQVAINGHVINAGPGNGIGTGVARLTDLRCGRYPYWAAWQFVTRTAGDEVAPIGAPVGTDALISGLQAAMSAHNPLPDYWLSIFDTFVFKNADRGPQTWIQTTLNGDLIANVCKSGASTQ